MLNHSRKHRLQFPKFHSNKTPEIEPIVIEHKSPPIAPSIVLEGEIGDKGWRPKLNPKPNPNLTIPNPQPRNPNLNPTTTQSQIPHSHNPAIAQSQIPSPISSPNYPKSNP